MKKRILTGLVLFSISLPLILLGGIYFAFGISVLFTYAIYELLSAKKIGFLPILLSAAFALPLVLYNYHELLAYPFYLIFLFGILIYVISVLDEKFSFEDANYVIIMTSVLSFFARSVLYLREVNDNANFILYILVTTMAIDTGAFLIGRKFGKHKLNKRISPNKTIEGSIAGILAGLAFGLLFAGFFPFLEEYAGLTNFLNLGVNDGATYYNFWVVFVFTIILSVFGQLGDLIFSLIKRSLNIKDFSNVLPGHGGVMDRLDSFTVNVIMSTLLFLLYSILL